MNDAESPPPEWRPAGPAPVPEQQPPSQPWAVPYPPSPYPPSSYPQRPAPYPTMQPYALPPRPPAAPPPVGFPGPWPGSQPVGQSPAVGSRVAWFGPDGEIRYGSAYPPIPPPPPRRRRWPVWVTLGVVGVLLLCVAPAAFVASRLPVLPADRAEAANPTPTPVPSPQANSPARVRAAWVANQIRTALTRQAEALVKGDQKAFLAVVDPKATKVTSVLKRRYASLRALRVTTYKQDIAGFPDEDESAGRPEWDVRIDIEYCLVVRECRTDGLNIETTWAETAAGLRLTAVGESGEQDNGPRPWEVSALRAAVGKRVVLATTSRYASRLPALLRQAEKAAAVADKFVIGGPKPDRYRIFVAGPSDWKRWYGGELPSWSVGFATGVSEHRMEVVLNLGEIQSSYLDEVLRHELGHVATLSSDDYAQETDFWLVEGIAEYIQESGRSVGAYDGEPAVRRYLESGKWKGKVDVAAPTGSTPDWQVAAAYGIGYYAVRRMAERFGRAKMIAFFTAVVLKRDGSLAEASREAFGVSWAEVNADCARYIRRNT